MINYFLNRKRSQKILSKLSPKLTTKDSLYPHIILVHQEKFLQKENL